MESETAVIPAEAHDLVTSVMTFAAVAKGLIIQSPEAYQGASEALREVATLTKKVDEARKDRTRPLDEEKKSIMAEYKPAEDALKDARFHIERERTNWEREQARIAAEAQRREEERAEKERIRLAKLAAKAEERGDMSKAAEFEQRAEMVVTGVVATGAPKAEGVGSRTTWYFEIEDESKLPREYLCADTEAIGGFVQSLKEKAIGRIPGVKVLSRQITIVRSK